jgi:PAS domain S-box-containing protein
MASEKEHDILDELSRLLLDTIMLVKPPQVPARFASVDSLQALYTNLISLRDFLYAASNGDLSNHVSFKGYIAGTLKTLQANLKHITWQTKMIASGDFTQRIEFMGEFSESFNAMVIQLDQTLKELVRKETELSQANQELLKEISIRKQAEAALRESEARNRTLVKNTSDVVFNLDDTGHITFVNPAAFRISGYKEEEIIGKHYATLIRPDMRDEGIKFLGRQFNKEQKKNVYYEYPIITKEGHEVWLGQNIQMIEEDGRITGFHSVGRDITERKRAEEALLQSEERFSKAFQTSPYAITITRPEDGKFVEVNDAFISMTGFTREEALATSSIGLKQWVNEDDRQRMMADIKAGRAVVSQEVKLRTKSGEVITGLFSAQTIQLSQGPCILSSINDITDRKLAEEALLDSERRLHTLVQTIPDLIWLKDKDGVYLSCNTMFERFFGAREADIIGKTDYDFVNRELADSFREHDNKAMAAGKITSNEEWITFADDGHRAFLDTIKTPMYDARGTLIGVLGIGRDITDRRSVERIRKVLRATVQAIVVTVETRDPYTAGHQRRVADLARSIATEMNLPDDQIDGIRMAATIHDLGKISVPADILTKPTKLKKPEFDLIKEHSQSGYDILKDIDFPWPVARMVLEHHERMNGSGYPNGLTGDNILLESRIIAVADVVESMGSHRPYRPSLGIEAALEEIEKNKGTFYDNAVADACMRLFREKGYQLQ